MSHLLNQAQKGVAKRMGVKSHATALNQLIRISGEVVTVGEVSARSGLDSRLVRKRYRLGKRLWADFGVAHG